MTTMTASANVTDPGSIGAMLRVWRQRRRLSQLELALEAGISQRHLSFIESGRSVPGKDVVLRLAEQLNVPLRDRNPLLMAAGYAPMFAGRALEDPGMAAAREAVGTILKGFEPHPALAVDRHWNMVDANGALAILLAGVDPKLLEPPVNALRVSLHPQGLAPRIVNFGEWRRHVLARLAAQIEASADVSLKALEAELRGYPAATSREMAGVSGRSGAEGIAVPLRLQTEEGLLSFISTTTIFGTALDVTLSELAIEAFLPADHETALRMASLVPARASSS
ncbi:helix-turn-helix domain-containing protein [Pannonibacter phragmitetus]|uniref:helix-turn-helix domain-containing protein n=1 Tax=Pannonibacter phragmitetus TaxID=121719 RepID=UPI000F02CE38|nr:helix-turn-helix transcriptional regulator [Pannonibacter phragmitetus]